MVVTEQDIHHALRTLGLPGQVVCLHSSLRSFGHVAGGANAVVRVFLDEGCTILVPTFRKSLIAELRHVNAVMMLSPEVLS